MNRREFLGGLAAAGLAPVVPVPALVPSAGASAPAAVAGNFTPYMYSMGVHHARTLGQCSAVILAENLGVSLDAAKAISTRLIKKGVLSAPNALGISRAINPLSVSSSPAPVSAPAKTWKMVDPVHAEYVEKCRLEESLRKLASEDMSEQVEEDETPVEHMSELDEDHIDETVSSSDEIVLAEPIAENDA